MDSSPFGWLSKGLWFGGQAQEARPYYLTDRLLACVYEESRESWNRSARLGLLSDGYKQYLRDLAGQLRTLHEGQGKEHAGVQFVNLSPAWRSPSVYAYFNNSVMEFPYSFWERPPGLGLVPLHIAFTVCSQMHQWLSLSPDNVVVLHARTCTGTGNYLVTFLAACHLVFSAGFDSLRMALDSLPPAIPKPRVSKNLFDPGSGGRGGRTLLPSQRRLGGYLASLLHYWDSGEAPRTRPLLLKGILASRLGCLDPASSAPDADASPAGMPVPRRRARGGAAASGRVLVTLYEAGQAVWTHGADLDVLSAQDDTLALDINVVVRGDVTIALWFADHVGEWEPPAAAYSFHTAFVEAGVLRVTAQSLDLPALPLGAGSFAEDEGLFMDVMLDDDEAEYEAKSSTADEGSVLQLDVGRMREGWEDLVDQTDGFLDFRPVADGGMEDVVSQIRAVQSVRMRPSQIPRGFFRDSRPGSAVSSAASSPTHRYVRRGDQSGVSLDEAPGATEPSDGSVVGSEDMQGPGPRVSRKQATGIVHDRSDSESQGIVIERKDEVYPSTEEPPGTGGEAGIARFSGAPTDEVAPECAGSDVATPVKPPVEAVATPKRSPPPPAPPPPPTRRSVSLPTFGGAEAAEPAGPGPSPGKTPPPPPPPIPSRRTPTSGPRPSPLHRSASAPGHETSAPSPPPPPPPPPPGGRRGAPSPKAGSPAPPPLPGTKRGGPPGTPPPPPLPGRKGAAPPPVPRGRGAPAAKPPGAGPPPGKKLRMFYWDVAPVRPGTVWEALERDSPLPSLSSREAYALDVLFEVKASTAAGRRAGRAGGGPGRGGPVSGAPVVKVIGLPRANNISIMLTQFSSFKSPESIRDTLLTGSDALGLDHLSLLMQVVPTEEESKALQAYQGPPESLSPPEQFCLVMSRVPRIISKIGALMFRLQFWSLVADAQAGMEAIDRAAREITSSARLQRVLAAILAAGNALNRGTARGNAAAFKMETLLKLADVKTTAPGAVARPPPPPQGTAGAAAGDRSVSDSSPALPDYLCKVHSLLEYVAWVVYSEEAKRSTGSGEPGVDARYLGGELASLGDAVRRMQTDVHDALRALQTGLVSSKRELVTEQEERAASAQSEEGAETRADAFLSVLERFLNEASERLASLKESNAATEAAARRALEWVGAGAPQDPAGAFEILHRFVAHFDAAFAGVRRLETQGAAKKHAP